VRVAERSNRRAEWLECSRIEPPPFGVRHWRYELGLGLRFSNIAVWEGRIFIIMGQSGWPSQACPSAVVVFHVGRWQVAWRDGGSPGFEWCGRGGGRGNVSSPAPWTRSAIVSGGFSGDASLVATRLVSVPGVLLCVENFFFLRKRLPVFLHKLWLCSPLFANDLGDVGICKSRVLGYDLGLVVLTI
jgi:hypothetical protein